MSAAPVTAETTETLDKVPPHGMKHEMMPEPPLSAGFVLMVAGAILVTALLVVAGLSLWSWWRRRAQKPIGSAMSIDPTAWERLLEAVAAIEIPDMSGDASEMTTQMRHDWNQFSGEVSVCLRRALELKTGKPFLERTTDEIKQWARQGLDLSGVIEDREFLDFLDTMDRVRFGGGLLTQDEARETLQRLREWISRLEKGSMSGHAAIDQKAVQETVHETVHQTVQQKLPPEPVRLETDAKGGLRVFDT
jgi:hypothetical protein